LDVAAEDETETGGIPPIFARKEAQNLPPQPAASAQADPSPRSESTAALLQQISEGLPKLDSRLAQKDSDPAASQAAPEQSTPVLMEPFSVFDERILELRRPNESLLERVNSTKPVFRHVGKSMTSELTFVDLARASNWGPFSVQAPLAVSLRFTLSW
jgi:hypothetical protein